METSLTMIEKCKKIIIRSLAVSCLCVTLTSPALSETKLNPNQIKALFPGVFTGTIKDKYDFNLTGHENGKLLGSGWGVTGEGRWSIENQKFCMHFWLLKNGKKCRTLYKKTKNSYLGRRDDGQVWITFKRMPMPRRVQEQTVAPFKAQN